MLTATLLTGYRHDGEAVEINQPIIEQQFREIERILGEPRQRFKSYAQAFHFASSDPRRTSALLHYLAEQRISHSIELRQTWAEPSDTATDSRLAGAEPSVSELVALAAQKRLSSEDLDEDVHDAASENAANINSEGLDGQIAYLVCRLGAHQTRARIDRAGHRDADRRAPEEGRP